VKGRSGCAQRQRGARRFPGYSVYFCNGTGHGLYSYGQGRYRGDWPRTMAMSSGFLLRCSIVADANTSGVESQLLDWCFINLLQGHGSRNDWSTTS
jgi:hypothetical protein